MMLAKDFVGEVYLWCIRACIWSWVDSLLKWVGLFLNINHILTVI